MSFLFALLGLVFGSFGSVLITRVPQSSSIGGRSGCPHCSTTLSPTELIPLLSFLWQRGKCAHCSAKIHWMYPVIESISASLFLMAWFQEQSVLPALVLGLFLWLFFIISVIDFLTQTISDALNIPLLLLAIAYGLQTNQLDAIGIAIGAGFFGAQWVISRGKWVGSGDIILGAAIGAVLGRWEHMVACLFLTYIIGGVIASALLLTKKIKRGEYVAFGPFLALGTLVSIVWQTRIDQFIVTYIGL